MRKFQAAFQERWGQLTDPHVRALAWLLDSPDLLDPDAPLWRGRVASLANLTAENEGPRWAAWINALDRNPAPLHAYIDAHPATRLGRYAEHLMAFFFRHADILHAHGVQVREGGHGKTRTLGEFDFLLWTHADFLVHVEFATKFYLLQSRDGAPDLDTLMGPTLTDTLGAKLRKIFDQQLSLSAETAAIAQLPKAVDCAQALIKGWLFYPLATGPCGDSMHEGVLPGIAGNHCSGFWRSWGQCDGIAGGLFLVLPRLRWLAPAAGRTKECLDRQSLRDALTAHFAVDAQPVLISVLAAHGSDAEWAVEIDRGFIVADDWSERAAESRQRRVLQSVHAD